MLMACHTLNRFPTKATNKSTYEMWCNENPNQIYLRFWGSREIVKLSGNKRKKLRERGLKRIFIGLVDE